MNESAEPVPPTLLDRLGEEAVRDWVERFYGRVASDEVLAPLFPPDLSESMAKQLAFFVQFLGGPPRYNEQYGQPFLRYRHRKVKIGRPERDAWMAALMATLRECTGDEALIAEIEAVMAPMADHMINHHPEKKDALHFN